MTTPTKTVQQAQPPQVGGANQIMSGASLSNSEVLNLLYQVLTEMRVAALKLQQEQTATSLAVGQAEAEATLQSGMKDAEATKANAVGSIVGASTSIGLDGAAIYKSNFGQAANTVSQHNQTLADLGDRKSSLPTTSTSAQGEVIVTDKPDLFAKDVTPENTETLRQFKSKEAMKNPDGSEMSPDQIKAAAKTMTPAQIKEAAQSLQSHHEEVQRERNSAQYDQQQSGALFRAFAQSANGLATGVGGMAASVAQADKAQADKAKALYQVGQEMVRSTMQNSSSLFDSAGQQMQSALQNLAVAQNQR